VIPGLALGDPAAGTIDGAIVTGRAAAAAARALTLLSASGAALSVN
jgi:hypothetical protein